MQTEALQSPEHGYHVPVRDSRSLSQVDADWATLGEVMDLLRYTPKTRPAGLNLRFRRRRLRAGQTLYAMEQQFSGLYVVRRGAFKSVVRQEDGIEHVISFSMRGDLLGTDGVCKDAYRCEAVALCDSDVIRVPADGVFAGDRDNDDVEKMLYWAISREMSREMACYALAHSSKSEVRVARFLASQSERFAQIGCSPRRFTLAMTRREIGSYLNVTLETVSRAFTSLDQLGIIEVSLRDITIRSLDDLRNFEG